MNLNLPGNIVSINERTPKPEKVTRMPCSCKEHKVKDERPYAISTRKLLFIIFIGLWVIDCLIAAWIIFHTVCG